jgi:hypothetical protein
MSRFLKVFAIGLLAIFIMVPVASAQRRGGGFHGGRGFYGGGWGGGWYGPGWGWYGPYYGYGAYPYWGRYYGGYESAPRSGEVKISGVGKDALVYVDGGYSGKAGDLKKFHLTSGKHEIELRDPSGQSFHKEQIEVLPGKTLEIEGNAGGH